MQVSSISVTRDRLPGIQSQSRSVFREFFSVFKEKDLSILLGFNKMPGQGVIVVLTGLS
jgi:hypothetical protein